MHNVQWIIPESSDISDHYSKNIVKLGIWTKNKEVIHK